nr:CBL-interacting serine/threonine-protein kinase 21 isoform X2 [Ziziphus jujuba var. spinosa]
MGFANSIGKYRLGRTIGEGTFAKVKLAVDTTNGQYVAIKIIDKHMVMESNLRSQVQREIRTMKLLHHPNIVRITEVIGTKTKIYIVMEYVSGGQLSDKLSYAKSLSEAEARKVFQQLIDAVDYCHNKGVYHRDLKPENLLLDSKGNVKVSDFGLSALHKPGNLLSTACGSPSYVAPELLLSKGYDGAAADIWSCGVILFELLSGYLPFDDRNLINLYKKEIKDTKVPKSSSFINAFQLIAMSNDLDLSGLFIEEDDKQKKMLGSKHTLNETIKKIEAAALDVSLSVQRLNNFKMRVHLKQKMTRCSRSYFDLSAEVTEVAPTSCVVQISKSAGELRLYREFCKSLSSLLAEESDISTQMLDKQDVSINRKSFQEIESSKEAHSKDDKDHRGYLSS